MFSAKKKRYRIDPKQANDTLQNIFAECKKEPSAIPFNSLISGEQKNARFFDRMIVLTAVVLALTFLSPLLAIPAGGALRDKAGRAELVSHTVENGFLYIQLKGDGIRYADAYQEFPDGSRESAVSYDARTSTVCFIYHDDREANLYIPVDDAPALHLLLTPR